MVNAEEVIEEFKHRAMELERDGERPRWTAEDIEAVIMNMIRRDDDGAE